MLWVPPVADIGVVSPAAKAVAALHSDQVDVEIQEMQRAGLVAVGARQPCAAAEVCLRVEHHVIAPRGCRVAHRRR